MARRGFGCSRREREIEDQRYALTKEPQVCMVQLLDDLNTDNDVECLPEVLDGIDGIIRKG